MGSGKTMACIRYLNTHPDEKYIYITPYLTEAHRIQSNCPALRFVEPNHYDTEDHSKISHTFQLVQEGRNITTTHQAFKSYTKEMLDVIQQQGYVLFIDESVDILERFTSHPADLQLLIDAGYVTCENGHYALVRDDYCGTAMSSIFQLLRSRELILIPGEKDEAAVFFWKLTPELITSFKDVYILTYLFSGQSIHHFLEIYGLPYEFIGVHRLDDGGYDFGAYPGYTPEYVKHIQTKLHVVDNARMNAVGDPEFALSMNWYRKQIAAQSDELQQLKRNVFNYFANMHRDTMADERLWASFLEDYKEMKTGTGGIAKSFLPFNTRATNTYRDKTCLAYLSNVFMNVPEKRFYLSYGIDVDEDMYALSVLVQWIWRSAIRDGEEVTLYIPSSRMRSLLLAWMDELSKGGGAGE